MAEIIEIQYVKGLNYSSALLPAMRAALALLETEQAEPVIPISWDNDAHIALIDGEVVGVITWQYSEWSKTVNIGLGWVEPLYRRRGIYRKLWNSLVHKAERLGAKHIIGTTHMDNHAMRAAAAKLGRQELSVNLSYRLK